MTDAGIRPRSDLARTWLVHECFASTIDLLVSDVIACLKIDVEGYETDVVGCAQESLRRGVDINPLEVSVGPSRDLKRDPWAAVQIQGLRLHLRQGGR